MGSAQSARRIQPGGAFRPCRRSRRIFPAPRSSRPLHPSVFSRLAAVPRSPLSPEGGSFGGRPGGRGGRAGGAGGGVGGGPPPGRRPAVAGRISTAAVRRDRLRDGWEGPGGEGGSGGSPASGRGGPPLPSVTAPRQQRSPNPGAEEARPVAALSPPPGAPPRGGFRPPRGRAGVSPGGPGRPSHGATAPPPPRPSSRAAPRGPRAGRRGGGADCPQCAPGGSRRRARGFSRGATPKKIGASERTGSAAMSATHPTRLETRTKESNTCASQGLARKPPWRNEGEGRRARGGPGPGGGAGGAGVPPHPPALALRPPGPFSPAPAEVGSRGLSSPPRAHHRPVSPAAPGRWSTSARVRTRKMVNYAWAGRSQRKLWWRSVAVLTCKSVVRPGYRGERLIEPSSSWFPPKFPSG